MCSPCSSMRPCLAAARRALAAQPPATLVDRDRLEPVAPAGLAEPPGSAEPGHAATEDGDPAPGALHPSSVRAWAIQAREPQRESGRRRSVRASRAAVPAALEIVHGGAQFEQPGVLVAGQIDRGDEVGVPLRGIVRGVGTQPKQFRVVEVHAGVIGQIQRGLQSGAGVVGLARRGQQSRQDGVVERDQGRSPRPRARRPGRQ